MDHEESTQFDFFFLSPLNKLWQFSFLTHYRNPSLGLATKAKGVARLRTKRDPRSHSEYSRECKRMSGSEPSHSQREFNFGSWSPDAFLNLQKEILGVKTP
jgi:hypothetical protein